MMKLPIWIELGAVMIGALSGGIHAVNRRADVVGTFAVALATSVGGGMLRDILIGKGPPLALTAPLYLPIVAGCSLVALLFASWLSRVNTVLNVLDALLLGMWTVMGTERALAYGMPVTAAVFLGTLTATGGGVMRDVLSGEAPSAFRKGELYISASFLAALTYVAVVIGAGARPLTGELVTVAVGFAIRLAAVRWSITAPEPFDLPAWWRRRNGGDGDDKGRRPPGPLTPAS
jgi:uncharacterized membrane protein YeiH